MHSNQTAPHRSEGRVCVHPGMQSLPKQIVQSSRQNNECITEFAVNKDDRHGGFYDLLVLCYYTVL
jgi:hypothetical protein